ncbi:nucleotide sugar dehydrogenase [Emticicia agri]|uniref:Nucleotide sugar dehydrogenase n=1 Tax=Emticicia agri TaxID=2492393 RepID=A0A4Q5LUT3_9BACT|nr:nucleotide sugar dehydrogenase [Emticicia agri]RYU93438.1 nucleotide sugar dehydrogenase [Emticicia agri]
MESNEIKIAVVGLGYVGLALSVEFGHKYPTIGFDTNQQRITELTDFSDHNQEITPQQIKSARQLQFSYQPQAIADCTIYIITVPTPVDNFKKPNLTPLLTATQMVAEVLKKNDIVIYESTVYPGCTEEDCVPVLEKYSGLVFNQNFFCGYSPERINPGDKTRTLTQIQKITSGSTPETAQQIDALYQSIIEAGTYVAPSIKVAEAAKVIENTQRDLNISFVNELALIFDKMGIDTTEVLQAAATKWNFMPFKPGLVGGNCISVDPHYLLHKSQSLGYHPQVILSGRSVNEKMGAFVASKLIKTMLQRGITINGSEVLVMGITFKENCPDIRNTGVIDVIKELNEYGVKTAVYDPRANAAEVQQEYDIRLLQNLEARYHGIILAVPHQEFLSIDFQALKKDRFSVIFDIKAVLDKKIADIRL